MEKGNWFTGPDWLLEKEQWPDQPDLKVTSAVSQESKPIKEEALFTTDQEPDEWESLLMRQAYWRVLRVTAWALRFVSNVWRGVIETKGARVHSEPKRSQQQETVGYGENRAVSTPICEHQVGR